MVPNENLVYLPNKNGLRICVVLKNDKLTIQEIMQKIKMQFKISSLYRVTIYRSLRLLMDHDLIGIIKARDGKDSDRYYLKVIAVHIDFLKNTVNYTLASKSKNK